FAKSACSTNKVLYPLEAASTAAPSPVAPPPITTISQRSVPMIRCKDLFLFILNLSLSFIFLCFHFILQRYKFETKRIVNITKTKKIICSNLINRFNPYTYNQCYNLFINHILFVTYILKRLIAL